MSFLAHLMSRGDLESQQDLVSTPKLLASAPPPPPLHATLQAEFEAAMQDAANATAAASASGRALSAHQAGVASATPLSSSPASTSPARFSALESMRVSGGGLTAAASQPPIAVATHTPALLAPSSLAALASPPASRVHSHAAFASLHLAYPSPRLSPTSSGHHPTAAATMKLLSPNTTGAAHAHVRPAGGAHRRTNSRERAAAAISLVPRHDYIPAHPIRAARIPPPASSPPPVHPRPVIARAASVDSAPHVLRSTTLVPITPPSSFVPPSPPPLTSPYKSILRTAHLRTDSHGVVIQNKSVMNGAPVAAPASTNTSLTSRLDALQSSLVVSPPPPSSTASSPAGERRSLRASTARATAATDSAVRDTEERKHAHRRTATVDVASLPLTRTPPTQGGRRRHLSYDAAAGAATWRQTSEEQEHKAAVNPTPSPPPSHALFTPPARRRASVSAAAGSLHPHSAPMKSTTARPRVRFDRAEIHEFDLVPDASKVPGGDGDFSIGMDRAPHTSWVASLDAYESMRATQRHADGPEAIEEEDRRRIWSLAQHHAEQQNETQRRRSGLKRLHPRQEQQLESARAKKRRREDQYEEENDDGEVEELISDEEEEEEEEEYFSSDDDAPMPGDLSAAPPAMAIAPLLAPPSPSASAPTSPSVSRPPSPSSACFRFVPAEDVTPPPQQPATLQRSHSAPLASTTAAHASPHLHSTVAASPLVTSRLLFSDHADLELIRASRRTAGCNCRGSKLIKVCGTRDAMQAEADKREEARRRAGKKAAAGGVRHSKTNTAAAAAAADSTESDSPLPVVAECPCVASGVGCNSNICRCFSYCCANTQERYVFNQAKVNSVRRKILRAVQGGK